MINSDDDFAALLLIPGVGRAKARALHAAGYSTLSDIAKADPKELAKVPGINLEMARDILNFVLVMISSEQKDEKPETPHELLICPLCGSMVSSGSSECPGCGIAFSDEVDDGNPDELGLPEPGSDEKDGFWYKKQTSLFICPECGSLVSDGSDVCPKCGVQFDTDDEPMEAPPAPAPGDTDGYWYKEDSTLFMCPNCGAFIKRDAQSCEACGIVFEADGEEEENIPEVMACPMCKALLPEGAKTCAECGFDFNKEWDGFWYKSQTELFMCPGCGAFIPKSATQCGNCGAALEEDEEPEPPTGPRACPMCNTELAPDAENCANCGFDFSVEKDKDGFWYKDRSTIFICPGCGAFISDAASSCMNCGLAFEGEEDTREDADIAGKMSEEKASDLERQVNDLIELVEMEDELDTAATDQEPTILDLAPEAPSSEPGNLDEVLSQDSLYLCPICGAFILPNTLKCPSCSTAFDDIEDLELGPAGSVQSEHIDPAELAREMATEIEEIEAELLEQPKKERSGVSKDFLDRWKKLEPVDESTIRKKAAETKNSAVVDIKKDDEIGDVGAAPGIDRNVDHGFWKDKARALASEGKLEEAIAFLDKAVDMNPEREMEYKRLMLELMGVEPSEKPVDLSEMATIDDIGELAIDEAVLSESNLRRIEEIERELVLNPDNGALWQERGECLEKLGRHQEAVECFDRSINISYSELRKDQRGGEKRRRLPQPSVGLTNGEGRVNGRVNGLLSQRGLINGSLAGMTNGKVNGIIRGRVNGVMGRTNGLLQGRVNGRVNGLVQGRVNGKVNGLTNGLAEGRINGTGIGLINGTGVGLVNGGLVNGLGLVNGEGMVNGTGNLRRLRQRRRERMMWRYRLTAMVMFVTVVLMMSMIGNLFVQEEGSSIQIDGNFADWNGVRSYYNFLEERALAPEMRILESRLLQESDRLNLFVLFGGDAFAATDGGVNSVWGFIDIDRDEETGYAMGDMGVDLAVEIFGWNRTVVGSNVLGFDAIANRDDWGGFARVGGAAAACSGPVMEASVTIPRAMVPRLGDAGMLVITLDSERQFDITDYIMARETGGVVATFIQEGDDIIQPGTEDVVMGRITLSAHSGTGGTIAGLQFRIAGNGAFDDFLSPVLRRPGGQIVPATVTADGNSGFNVTFTDYLDIAINTTLVLTLETGIATSATGKAVGVSLTDIVQNGGGSRIRNQNTILHNIGQPGEMSIDGAFGDWAAISAIEDPEDDVSSPVANASFINKNIDLAEGAFTMADNSLLFYLAVHGTMMGGESLPTVRYRPGSAPATQYTDSDRDTVPDLLDPHPFDFTNDGITDERMQTPDGLPDVDGDGIADHPRGPDRWLNTTIPDDFPEPYAGRFVSIYIGPVETRDEKSQDMKGDDRAYILIDSDDESGTGQNLRGGIGIDRVVVISGKSNRIIASELYRYDPDNSETGWVFAGNVSTAIDWNRMEGAINLQGLDLLPGNNFTVYISIEDWKGSTDSTEQPFGLGVAANSGTRSPAGDNVVLNEISAFGDAEWVEVCNPTAAAIDIGLWTIQVQGGGIGNYKIAYIFPAGTTIGAFGSGSEYLVASTSKQFLDNKWSNVRLVAGGAIVDEVASPVPVSGVAHARFKNATWGMPQDTDAAGDWYTSIAPTSGAPNDRRTPIMTIFKSGDKANVAPGGTITYYVWYNNTGEGNARHVWLNDTLPIGTGYMSSSAPYSSYSGQEYRWYFSHVPPGSHSFSISVRVDSGVAVGTILTNSATLEYTDQLSRAQTGSSDSFDTVVEAPNPTLILSKAVDLASPFPGESVTFTIYYNNTGTVSAPHVWLNDTLPAGMTYVSGSPAPTSVSGQNIYWYFQDVPVGTNYLVLQAQIGSAVAPGTTLTNTVTCDYKDHNGDSQPLLQAQSSVTVGNPINSIVINEIVSLPNPEWIELCNPSAETVGMGGWALQYYQGNWKNIVSLDP
ncbi:MAG: zinc ribbon domain-containing protein, partial [Thermoplasmata archaeon]